MEFNGVPVIFSRFHGITPRLFCGVVLAFDKAHLLWWIAAIEEGK